MDVEAGFEIERRLVALARSTGPLRVALAEIACWLVQRRAWERLGYARLADYADERVGRSARSVQDLARVGLAFYRLPRLRDALAEGRLGWTQTRLVARVATAQDEERWIEHARGITADVLSREVRKVDRGSVEASGLEEGASRSRWFEVACTREVRARWCHARQLARRVHGGRLSLSDSAEMIAAEVLSALPLEPDAVEPTDGDDAFDATAVAGAPEAPEATGADGTSWAEAAPPRPARPGDPCAAGTEAGAMPIPPALEALLRDAEHADAFELDRRLRAAVEMERRLDARIGPLLETVLGRRIFWTLGYATRDAYVRERLGFEPSWGRALLRIERAARASPTFARAYRSGRLSALQAATLVPLVGAALSERFSAAWVERAGRFPLRRLRDDVERALLVCETDFDAWRRTGGLPRDDVVSEAGVEAERRIGAEQSAPRETCTVRAILDADVARLLRAVLCSVRRRLERATGHLPSEGEALGAMLEHALAAWGARDGELRCSHAIFARDGWRCVIPGCTSMRNLHVHHIAFRSAGSGDAPANRVTLCAFHHLRGVHAGSVRCTGSAPDALRIALGVRPDGPSLALYASGDRLLSGPAPVSPP
jgi:hypothetical protein